MVEEEGHSDLAPLSFFPEISYKSPTWIVPSLYQRKEDILVPRDEKFETKISVQTNLIKLTLTFLVTSSPLTIPGTNLLVLSILYKLIISLSKTYKKFLLCSPLWVFIPLWRLSCTCKKVNKICFFKILKFKFQKSMLFSC